MKKGLTEIVFILDRSGSMSGLEGDTIGGFNSLIKKQRLEEGDAIISTVLFDDKTEVLHDRMDIKDVELLTEKEYYVRGNTALLDAVGSAIRHIGNVQKYMQDECRSEKVMVIITTDGYENASKEYTVNQIKSMIERQKERYGWEFIFLGANIDAADYAHNIGITEDRCANYNNDSEGTKLNFMVMEQAISHMRSNGSINDKWKNDIDRDFKIRGRNKD